MQDCVSRRSEIEIRRGHVCLLAPGWLSVVFFEIKVGFPFATLIVKQLGPSDHVDDYSDNW